jgi:hypothetical protein
VEECYSWDCAFRVVAREKVTYNLKLFLYGYTFLGYVEQIIHSPLDFLLIWGLPLE